MKKIETRTEEVQVVADILCDRCGKSLRGHLGNFNGIHFSWDGAYDGTAFPDGYGGDVDVCEECTAYWFRTFVRDPLRHATRGCFAGDELGVPDEERTDPSKS